MKAAQSQNGCVASPTTSSAEPSAAIDLSKIKPGDEVTVRGVVRRTRDEPGWPALEVELNLEGGICYPNGEDIQEVSMGLNAIASHTPRALGVGDRVRKLVPDWGDDGKQRVYVVTAIDSDGWCLLSDRGPSSRVTTSVNMLERLR